MKHRTTEEVTALKKSIVSAIIKETPMKCLVEDQKVSVAYAYNLAKDMGYAQMMLSEPERKAVRVKRGTAKAAKSTTP